MLASTGSYQGQLDHIIVDGKTTTPNFSLDIANRPVPLNTTFHAIVDGTNGDTYLQPVDAWLLHSHIIAQGRVVRVPGIRAATSASTSPSTPATSMTCSCSPSKIRRPS